MNAIRKFLTRISRQATRRKTAVTIRAMGRERKLFAYDLGEDTFIFEEGVARHIDEHASVLMINKRHLRRGTHGHVMTITTGNHSVAALPLLSGKLWDLTRLASSRCSAVMRADILCANIVAGKIEVSQRDVPCKTLTALDDWLINSLGFALGDVVMIERNVQTLEHYRARGLEWRIKPLAWTEAEIRSALAMSRKRISTNVLYYHNMKGVHFFTYPDFHSFVLSARTAPEQFFKILHELVGVFEGHTTNFLRQPKFHGHHEIEFFGLKRGVALEKIIPALEELYADLCAKRITNNEVITRIDEIDSIAKTLLQRPSLEDNSSRDFIETLYMHLTGEVYALVGDGSTPAFDDRRTALPGASFMKGRPQYHPGCDARSEVLISNLRSMISKDEYIEYANVYELRNDASEDVPNKLGMGSTREIVYKTNRRPLPMSLVEKRLSRTGHDYGSYVLSRVEAFKALGVGLGNYRLLRRRAFTQHRPLDFYIRTRCEGDPLWDIPAANFLVPGEFGGTAAGEDPQVLTSLAFLMGDAAAQNLAMKKFDPDKNSSMYGVGKEIYSFAYDIKLGRLMPQSVACCSVRGACGWPCLDYTTENLNAIGEFYMTAYAKVIMKFAQLHPTVPAAELAQQFFDGLAYRIRAMVWKYTVQRDEYDMFKPNLPTRFRFPQKWHFALWALERHARRLNKLQEQFFAALPAEVKPITQE